MESSIKQEYSQGEVMTECEVRWNEPKKQELKLLLPDAEIFETVEFNFDTIKNRLRQQSYLTKGVTITVTEIIELAKDLNSFLKVVLNHMYSTYK
jgi:DNA gyrase subunit B